MGQGKTISMERDLEAMNSRVEHGRERLTRLAIPLFIVLCSSALVVALFPPTVQPAQTEGAVVKPAQNAVILPVILSAYMTINRGTSHILAVSNISREWGGYGLAGHIYPSVAKLPIIGRMIIPEPEQLLRVRPDVLITHKQQSDVLRKIGMQGLVEINMMPRKPLQTRLMIWKQLGQVTGNGSRVSELMRWDAAQRQKIAAVVAAAGSQRPRVLLAHVGNRAWSVPGGGYALGASLEEAGAINVAASFRLSGRVNLEQLLALDPEIIVLDPNVMMSPYASSHDTTPLDVYKMPECQMLRAVKTRRVYQLPMHSYTNESIEDPLLLSWMAEIFHPEQTPHRLRDVYRETYQTIYGYALTDDEIDRALFLSENSRSEGYERFARQGDTP